MSAAPTTTVLNDPARSLLNHTARANIINAMNASVFNSRERKATMQAIKDCDDPEQLHRWLKGIRRERDERERQMRQACEDGTFATGLAQD